MSKKKVIVACGGAVATSTVAAERIRDIAKEVNVELNLVQCRISEIDMYIDGTDFIVTTSKVTQDYGVPLLHGMAFVSGINEDALAEKIVSLLTQ